MSPNSVHDQYLRIGNFCIDHDLMSRFADDAQHQAADLWDDCALVEAREDQDDLVAVVTVPKSAEFRDQTHSVTIRINEGTGVWSVQCDCGAQRGCGHVVAALLHIEHDSGAAMEVVDSVDDMLEPR